MRGRVVMSLLPSCHSCLLRGGCSAQPFGLSLSIVVLWLNPMAVRRLAGGRLSKDGGGVGFILYAPAARVAQAPRIACLVCVQEPCVRIRRVLRNMARVLPELGRFRVLRGAPAGREPGALVERTSVRFGLARLCA
jgi:hypothetical protein